MDKQRFKQEQPIVYQMVSNALKRDHLAHAYLFTGPKGVDKRGAALLFAQSLVCEHVDEDGFACQECDSCKRLEKEESTNFFWLKDRRIKKQDILDVQMYFQSTSMEKSNRRIYILEGFDQATPDASNSLLKFLEEPQPGIFGILIADERSAVLPTIQSRCQWISFRPESPLMIQTQLQEFIDEESAHVLVYSGYTLDQAKALFEDQENFERVCEYAKKYLSNLSSMDMIVTMQSECFVAKSNLMDKKWVLLWMQWLLIMLKQDRVDVSLDKNVRLRSLLVESMDVLNRPVDVALFLDRLYNQIRKVVIA